MNKLLLPLLIALIPATALAREWVSKDGAKTFEGQLISYAPPSVTVVRSDGRRLTFNEGLLSDSDKRYCLLANRVLSESYANIPYKVIQVLEFGVLGIEQAYNNPYNSDELFFIWGDYTLTAAENDAYRHNIYWAGSYHYTTVKGVRKTIRSFAPSLDEAVSIWEYRLNPPKGQENRKAKFAGVEAESLSSSGTGFAISGTGHIVTNCHVIEGATKISVFVGGRKVDAKVVATDKINDLAILKIAEKTNPLFLQTRNGPDLGDSVTVAGYPNPSIQGRSLKITKGTLSGVKGIQDDIRHFQIDAAVQPGNSGGPLLDGSGAVMGIVNARLNDAAVALATGSIPQNVNYAIKLDYLVPLMKTVPGLMDAIGTTAAPRDQKLSEIVSESVLLVESEIGQ